MYFKVRQGKFALFREECKITQVSNSLLVRSLVILGQAVKAAATGSVSPSSQNQWEIGVKTSPKPFYWYF